MEAIESQVNPHDPEFLENAAYHRGLAAELRQRLETVRQGGGEKYQRRHAEQGKLFVRERINRLLDPGSPAAQAYVSGHPDPEPALAELRRETAASVACLGQLQSAGKQVVLKFYDGPPFWKLVFTGEYVWVRSSHSGLDSRQNPEYVFALRPDKPNRGFFPAFYTYFLSQWNDPSHPTYSFESDELVYRDAAGQELERRPWNLAESGLEAQPIPAA